MKKLTIKVRSGKGGNGIVSLKRSFKVPLGGPDGGNGGAGGNVYLEFIEKIQDFDKKIKNHIIADSGKDGEPNNKNGRAGKDIIIKVPKNYKVYITKKGEEEKEITKQPNQLKTKIARGGQGGWGNKKFVLPTRRTPRFSQNGQDGEETSITVLQKPTSNVVIVGEENTGKTTLLNKLTGTSAKVAAYIGTTQSVNLGVYEKGKVLLTVADVPNKMEDYAEFVEEAFIVVVVSEFFSSKNIFVKKITELTENKKNLIRIITNENSDKSMKNTIYGQTGSVDTVDSLVELFVDFLNTPKTKQVETSLLLATKNPVFKKRKYLISIDDEGRRHVSGGTPNLFARTLDLSNSEARYEFFRRMRLLGLSRDLSKKGIKDDDLVCVAGKEIRWRL
jgi:small GTP-binding protein